MNRTIRVFSGRKFSSKDIELIRWIRKTYPKLSRKELAGTICELLGWLTPAGRAKIQQCLAFLEKLEGEGIIELPPLDKQKQRRCAVKIPELKVSTEEIRGEARDFEPIHLEIARPGEELKRWRAYVNQYHMLGDKWVFGSRLQYFIKSREKELGCLQFSASAWALTLCLVIITRNQP